MLCKVLNSMLYHTLAIQHSALSLCLCLSLSLSLSTSLSFMFRVSLSLSLSNPGRPACL